MVRARPPSLIPALLLSLALGLPAAHAPSWAVPAFPGKAGPQAPREGFSTARLAPDFAQMPARGERIAVQAQGTYRVLAIRVSFSDLPIDSSTAYYNRILFFLNQYWSQASDGAVSIVPTVADSVFTLPHTQAYYGDDAYYQQRLVYLVRDAIELADSTIDFRPYNSIIIFHAGQGQETDVRDDSRYEVWSAFVTPQDFQTILPDSTGATGIKTNDLISGTTYYRVKEAVVLPESESQEGYVFGMTGVTCHEFGHQLGLPDLYDTTPGTNGNNQGLGSWDIMAQGVWNANGFVPAGPCAWDRAYLGFIAPTRITQDGPVTLAQLERAIGALPRIAQIPITQSEYFLLENRRQDLNDNGKFDFQDVDGNGQFDFYTDSYAGAEFDFFLPGSGTGSGVLVYHVDDAKIAASLLDNDVEGDTNRKGVDLVEASGIEDLDQPANGFNGGSPEDVFRRFGRDKFTPDTTPSTEAYGHIPTGIRVTGIGPPDTTKAADSTMSFQVAFDRNRPGWPVTLPGRVKGVPALAVDLDGNGVLELIVAVNRLNNTAALYVLEPDGTDFLDRDGNPATRDAFAVTNSPIVSTPCVGDIDGDGKNEIVFATQNGAVWALHADGTEVLDGDNNPATTGVLIPPGAAGTFTKFQPILVDLDGDGTKEIVYGRSANAVTGGSFISAVKVTGGGIVSYSLPMGGGTDHAPAAADLNGDGFPDVIVPNVYEKTGDYAVNGLSVVNWEMFTDPLLPTSPEDYGSYMVQRLKLPNGSFATPPAGPFSPPIIADINRDGIPDVIVADGTGALHALDIQIAPHIAGDVPATYLSESELTGWPVPIPAPNGALPEVSLGDLDHSGYDEVFWMGADARVAAVHYNGAMRSGYPLRVADSLAVQDTVGVWPPLIADVDRDGNLDVVPVVPDGRRPAFRRDGVEIRGFGQLGSTGTGPPPLLVDLDGNGTAEWVETFEQGTNSLVSVQRTAVPIAASSVAWPQYRYGPTRDGHVPTPPAGAGGTPILSEVYGYPNPATGGRTTIHYRLGTPARKVSVRIYDPTGSKIAELPTGPADLEGSTEHNVVWTHDGSTGGSRAASGPYLARVEADTAGGTEVLFAKIAILR